MSSGSEGEKKSRRRRAHSPEQSDRESKKKRKISKSSESDTESSTDSEEERRKKKKKKKKKKEKKKEKEKRKKEKKKKKKKKKEENDEIETTNPLTSLNEQWGKHGIIYEVDIHAKAPEYYAWLLEVKHQPREFLSRKEEKQMFKEFMEDYNTATFPHEKYYNLAAWQAKEKLLGGKSKEEEFLTDEERLARERLEESRARQQELEDKRTYAIMQHLKKAKEEDSGKYDEIQQDYWSQRIKKETLESLAEKRFQRKAAADERRINRPIRDTSSNEYL